MTTAPILADISEAIDTKRLHMRVPRPGDGMLVFDAVVDSLPELRRFPASLPWAHREQTLAFAESFCRNAYADFIARKDFPYLLFDRNAGTLVGCAGVHRVEWEVPKCEIGYWCRTSMVGNGYITEAVRGLVGLALAEFNAQRIEIMTDDANEPSWRVCERAGFQLEGTLRRDRRAPDGTLRDTRIYAYLAQQPGSVSGPGVARRST